ncbi:MAG: hypothetical protein Q9168_002367 [Polycauliona sp. 1 TL-2023]
MAAQRTSSGMFDLPLEGDDWVHVFCKRNAFRVSSAFLKETIFSQEFARQRAIGQDQWELRLPNAERLSVLRLMEYPARQWRYVRIYWSRIRAANVPPIDSTTVAEDYIIAFTYNAEVIQKDIISSLGQLGISPEQGLKKWLDFVAMVYQGLAKPDAVFETYFKDTFDSFLKTRSAYVQYNDRGLKALVPATSIETDVFFEYHSGVKGEQQHILAWMMPEKSSPDEGPLDEGSPDEGSPDEGSPDEDSPDEGSPDEDKGVQQCRWELHPSAPNDGADKVTQDTTAAPT